MQAAGQDKFRTLVRAPAGLLFALACPSERTRHFSPGPLTSLQAGKEAPDDLLAHFQLRGLFPTTQKPAFVSSNPLKDVRCDVQLFSGPGTDLLPLLSQPAEPARPPVTAAQLVTALELRAGPTELAQASMQLTQSCSSCHEERQDAWPPDLTLTQAMKGTQLPSQLQEAQEPQPQPVTHRKTKKVGCVTALTCVAPEGAWANFHLLQRKVTVDA